MPTYASAGLWLDEPVDALLADAERFVAQGHRAMKMRLGRSRPAEDGDLVPAALGRLRA